MSLFFVNYNNGQWTIGDHRNGIPMVPITDDEVEEYFNRARIPADHDRTRAMMNSIKKRSKSSKKK